MNKKLFILGFASFLLCFTGESFAQNGPGDVNLSTGFYKAYPLGMGGAWRALAEGCGAIEVAPAGLAFKKSTAFSFDYGVSGYMDTRIISGSFYDSKSFGIAAGFTFNRYDFSLEGSSGSTNQFIIALAQDVGGKISFGMNLKYIMIKKVLSQGGELDTFTGDLGVTVRPIPQLSFSTSLQNLYTGTKYPQVPLLLSFGSAVILGETAKLSTDWERDFSTGADSKINYYFGGEAKVAEGVLFRSGFGLDRVRNNPFFGIGLGFNGPKLSLDFTFSERLNPVDQSYALGVQVAF